MKYFDSHAHYWDDRLMGQSELLPHLFDTSVSHIINVATDPDTCRLTVNQAQAYPRMYTALGIHPSDCQNLTGEPEDYLPDLRALITDPASKCVAVGEIGLDYYWQPVDYDRQRRFFEAQLAMAEELDLPVVIHDRDAHGDCFDTVCKYPRVRGVFHSYSGSAEMAKDLIRRGWYISFSGTVTFKNARKVREVAAALPHGRVLIETDAPYLTPHPHRGECNHSGYLAFTNAALAEVWGISEEETARITAENACRLFGIPSAE